GGPVARERLHSRQLHALRAICDELLAGPAQPGEAPAQVDECLLRHADAERADADIARGALFHGFLHHGALLVSIFVIHRSPITPQVGFASGSLCATISVSKSDPIQSTTRSRNGSAA